MGVAAATPGNFTISTGPEAQAPSGNFFYQLRIELLEQSPYTTTLAIHYALMIDGALHREPDLHVRGYHDARLAEVLAIRAMLSW